MKIDRKAIDKISKLAHLQLSDEKSEALQRDLSQIFNWVEQLEEVDTDNIEPMFSVHLDQMPVQKDVVSDGDYSSSIVANAPEEDLNMFVVPKVVE